MQPMPENPLQRGDKVVFKDIALRDYEAVFQCKKGSDRVMVLMEFISQQARITVPASAVRRSD